MNIIVGAPVFRREWMLDQWFDHVRESMEFAGVKNYSFAFVGDLRDPSFEVIGEQPEKTYIKNYREPSVAPMERTWNHPRYHKMVELRNILLEVPRQVNPDYFLSLDTDILLHMECVTNLIETADMYDAVGGKVYMTKTGNHYPSWAKIDRFNNLQRSECVGVVKVDAIMALKLMSPNAYRTDYKFHKQGEDIGWSLNVRKQGMTIGFDGRIASKHIMEPNMLDKFDKRCGF